MSDFDVIVVGSGAGGLTAAVALARAGKRVLVCEQHYVPGGWCHSFTLDGYRFSPGVHYIGEMQPGGPMRSIYEGLGVAADVTFLELNPEGYDHILVGSDRFDVPKGKERWAQRLAEKVPGDARAVRAYLDAVERIGREIPVAADLHGWKDLLTLPFKAPTLFRYGMSSLESVFRRIGVRDPLARTILALAPCGDHGLPPSRVPFSMHAGTTAHYFGGGYFPKGGGFAIPRAFVRALKRAGGEVRLRTPIERILVERDGAHRRAVGVRLQSGEEVRAPVVISNADPGITFGRLMDPGDVDPKLLRKLRRTTWSAAMVSLFLAVDMDLEAAGLDSGNFWYAARPDVDDVFAAGERLDPDADGPLPWLFLTVTTLKDRSKMHRGHHTLELFTGGRYDLFARWERTAHQERPDDYEAMKAKIERRMLETAERIAPGISRAKVFSSVGTPLTNLHYVGATRGNAYGIEKTRGQIGPWAFPVRTPTRGLWLCGASTGSHGVMGATISGLLAASSVLRVRPKELLRRDPDAATIRTYPCDDVSAWPDELRERAERGGRRVALHA